MIALLMLSPLTASHAGSQERRRGPGPQSGLMLVAALASGSRRVHHPPQIGPSTQMLKSVEGKAARLPEELGRSLVLRAGSGL